LQPRTETRGRRLDRVTCSERRYGCSGERRGKRTVLCLKSKPEIYAIDNDRPKVKQLIIAKGSHNQPRRSAPRPSRVSTTLRALKHRNFQLFFSGQLISLVGTWMQSVAQSWLVYRKTGSSLLLGTVGFASQIPVFLVAPLGGMVADRNNRHRVIIATQVASMTLAFILAALTLSQRIQVWHILVLAALLGVVNAFDIPGRQSFLVDMVGKEDLMNAIALNSSMFNGARIVGPAIAGVLVAKIGEGWCFLANALSYIAVIVGLLMMKVQRPVYHAPPGSPLAHMIEGFSFARRTTPIRNILLLLGVVSLVAMPYSVLMPVFANNLVQGGVGGLGIFMGSKDDPRAVGLGILMCATGIGALLGALTLATRSGVRGLGRWVAFSCVGFGFCLVLFSISNSFWLSTALLVPVGFCMMLGMSSSNTLIQVMVPDRLRGRIMAVYSMMFMGMAPFGAFLGGAIADRLGARVTVAMGGVGAIGGAAIFGVNLSKIRVEARRLIVAQEAAGGEPSQETTARIVED
jgi:MFS family permease